MNLSKALKALESRTIDVTVDAPVTTIYLKNGVGASARQTYATTVMYGRFDTFYYGGYIYLSHSGRRSTTAEYWPSADAAEKSLRRTWANVEYVRESYD